MTGDDRKETEKDTRDKAETLKSSIDHMLETNDLHDIITTYFSALQGLAAVYKERLETVIKD